MDYKKKYEEALERAKQLSKELTVDDIVEQIFPELKESEDERIRKWLIALIKSNEYGSISNVGKMPCPKLNVIAWLEKRAEQKPAKIEPKFKVGDWIIDVQGVSANQIIGYEDDSYHIKTSCSKFYLPMKLAEKNYRLWTIEDAKDGDVLTVDNIIFIYKRTLASHIVSYCSLINDVFESTSYARTCCEGNPYVHPATKKQRDTLMKAMTDAGYEWDAEKKKLMKIEQKPAEWSEEDESRMENLCHFLKEYGNQYYGALTLEGTIHWLKSLKDRIQPQPMQEWSEKDEQLYNDLSDTYFYNDEDYPEETYKKMLKRVLDWMEKRAKSLRSQSIWKPSEDQLYALDYVLNYHIFGDTNIREKVQSLYDDLKKL